MKKIYNMLEATTLPRFLAFASTNINLPKQIFWYSLGCFNITISIVIAVALILTVPTPPQSNRAWRLFSAVFAACGSGEIYSAWRGFCSQIWRRGNMQLHVWELQETDEESKLFVRSVLGNSWPSPSPGRLNFGQVCNSPDGTGTKDGKPVPIYIMDKDDSKASIPYQSNPRKGSDAKNGFSRPPIFGPERVVLDPFIQETHRRVMRDILVVAIGYTLVFSAIVLSVPARVHI